MAFRSVLQRLLGRSPARPRLDAARDWTEFETAIFNAVTLRGDREAGLFSRRLRVTDAMLRAYDEQTIPKGPRT